MQAPVKKSSHDPEESAEQPAKKPAASGGGGGGGGDGDAGTAGDIHVACVVEHECGGNLVEVGGTVVALHPKLRARRAVFQGGITEIPVAALGSAGDENIARAVHGQAGGLVGLIDRAVVTRRP